MNLTHFDFYPTFGATTLARGLQYFKQHHVLKMTIEQFVDEVVIYATTAGRGKEIYTQTIALDGTGSSLIIDGDCSCPVGYNCKHVAAVCLTYKERARSAPSSPQALTALSVWLRRMIAAGDTTPPPDQEMVVYVLSPDTSPRATTGITVQARIAKPRSNGSGYTRGRNIRLERMAIGEYSEHAASSLDRDIANLLLAGGLYWHGPSFAGRAGGHAFTALLESGRCFWLDSGTPALRAGPARELELAWQASGPEGALTLTSTTAGDCLILPTTPALYLDPSAYLIGPLNSHGLSAPQLKLLASAPRLAPQEALGAAQLLANSYAQLAMPLPVQITTRENTGQTPQPCLGLYGDGRADGAWLVVDFCYGSDRIDAWPRAASSMLSTANEIVHVLRDPIAEDHAHSRLCALGFSAAPATSYGGPASQAVYVRAERDTLTWASAWSQFLREDLPQLRAAGWQIEQHGSFDLHFDSGTWTADIADTVGDSAWFSLGFSLDFAGTSLPLLDVLAPVLDADWSALPDTVAVPVGARRFVEVPSARLLPLLDTLRALFADRSPIDDQHRVRLSRYDVGFLSELEGQGLTVEGGQRWRQLAKKLSDFDGIRKVPVPAEISAELRVYQQRGLDWLQFLREYGFNGVLADDMGLGKTLQTLAHLVVEKNAGRLDRPALLVAPTSLMGNWQREAARFAPTLKLAVLHGADRSLRYVGAETADLLLTTYPLLPRDAKRLAAIEFHSVILDEAQNVKNPRAKAAQVLRQLHTHHRLCLTGTPLENHLGELWALFDFLMPGFLGDTNAFRRIYRTPIEQHGDVSRQALLARRIAPFLLRRTKAEVAAELPPKTEMVQPIELGPAQAELYESIRASMDKRVRDAIARQGLARSHITILDALLKLRQVCCDPRLLKLDTRATRPPSAKLVFLLELLAELIAEGRKILLFSQFTSMLALIEIELQARAIGYTKLTGQTRKRDDAIDSFQRGEVPVFLISLKAGGVGLNLPEADTVIHYDPWWNPAVEAQATDRAHRIGQTQPVFVYKLIVANSVEARMLDLQERKRALAAGIYAGQSNTRGLDFDADALAALLAPIEHDVLATPGNTGDAKMRRVR